jgi:hypothetical protein
MLLGRARTEEYRERSQLSFGNYLERDADLLTLRRADGSFAAALSARGMDPFEDELTLWEDAA